MEKVLQILAVFALLMLVIWRSIRMRDERFRRFSFLGRVRPPLPEEVEGRLVVGKFGRAGRSEGPGEWYGVNDGEGEVHGVRGEVYGVPGEGYRVRGEADGFLWDEDSRILFAYRKEGKLTIYRRMAGGRNRELQELSVPMDCTSLGWDPVERRIYLEEGGDWFVYGEE